MTTISSTAGQPVAASGGLLRFLDATLGALLDHLERRAAIKALHELDDHALKDIGISRSQIEAAVGGALNPDRARRRREIASGSP